MSKVNSKHAQRNIEAISCKNEPKCENKTTKVETEDISAEKLLESLKKKREFFKLASGIIKDKRLIPMEEIEEALDYLNTVINSEV